MVGSAWDNLTQYLAATGQNEVRLRFHEIERIIGRPLPASKKYQAFWSNGSSYGRSWTAAGYWATRVGCLPEELRFLRTRPPSAGLIPAAAPAPLESQSAMSSPSPDVFLVGCVKSKQSMPAPARELFVSPLFTKAALHVEDQRSRWFVLSAEYGLLEPCQVVGPYDLYRQMRNHLSVRPGALGSSRTCGGGWALCRAPS